MKKYEVKKQKQMELFEKGNPFNQPAKRINIVSLKLVRESSILYKKRRISSPEDAYKLLKEFLVESDRERFVVVCLDTKNQPTAINICHVGSLNASIVHPREVMKAAILSNAASVIVGHNHPSQDPTPSTEDIEVTKRLVEAGKIIGIEVIDHLVVCEEKYVSLKEKGYF
ncbi:DNA repair protein RadC [Cytobacillus firmus]|uniref:JAB domain-containing protein n=1 Tax=Cytobacillus firmus TaxID=1399 RepID=UPI00077C5131|nr:DNA repair protein RadC [Cytobacillus firmus]MBG9545519.1 DNA repair protein RadC [Cytobacillus firmus]MBG9550257.1 DNA repair protein RadC [Cytobacillus firmus]MBG9551167.1 DNA repair protein RadC [Cytobacillus firmus]MBG9557948.1 DNA repair protein RadC [Cytobacillus firmus]MBG9577573.1 DNA repair protein RadC [Cytobacillus firmus]